MDLAEKKHWDYVYANLNTNLSIGWQPDDYNSLVLEDILIKSLIDTSTKSILEIGCGNSTWLPYLAKKTKAKITGIDYSEEGCLLLQKKLALENLDGTVLCNDIFKIPLENIICNDFVYSLGVVEHFIDLKEVVSQFSKFVEQGGRLFTEVPNLFSIHGILCWIYQPALLKKHKLVTKNQLMKAYKANGFTEIKCHYAGLFSMSIVAWGIYQRFPKLSKFIDPFIMKVNKFIDRVLRKSKIYKGIPFFAPYIYIIGEKP